MKGSLSCTKLCLLAFCFTAIFSLFDVAEAQNRTTNPSEVTALNLMFARWGILATDGWNISGEVCSGVATDTSAIENINPGIKCGCTDRNGTLCHITALRVYALDVAGAIPNELWNLTFLTNLDCAGIHWQINSNAVHVCQCTCEFKPCRQVIIVSMSSASYFYDVPFDIIRSIGINALSGELPRELGNLTDLRSLSFGTNNFSGPLPSELGNLTRLTQIYFDSAGVNGPIPSTLARLRNMTTVWASDNALSGQIPDFIGEGLKETLFKVEYHLVSPI